MKVTPLRLNNSAHPGGIFPFPFARHDIVGLKVGEIAKHLRECSSWRLFEREYRDVVIVKAQELPMALQRGIAELEVNEAVAAQGNTCRFERCVIDELTKYRV